MRQTLLVLALLALAVVPSAAAHVNASPDKVPAGSDSVIAIVVPTEENVPTVKISVQLPAALSEVSFQTKPGWSRTFKGKVVTWSGGKIAPGEFDEFVLRTHVPATPGKQLLFPAIQTYASGKVVHWIGAETSDTPAPRVTLEAAQSATTPTTTTPTPTTSSKDTGSDRDKLALGIAIAGLLAGLIALGLVLARGRRRA